MAAKTGEEYKEELCKVKTGEEFWEILRRLRAEGYDLFTRHPGRVIGVDLGLYSYRRRETGPYPFPGKEGILVPNTNITFYYYTPGGFMYGGSCFLNEIQKYLYVWERDTVAPPPEALLDAMGFSTTGQEFFIALDGIKNFGYRILETDSRQEAKNIVLCDHKGNVLVEEGKPYTGYLPHNAMMAYDTDNAMTYKCSLSSLKNILRLDRIE